MDPILKKQTGNAAAAEFRGDGEVQNFVFAGSDSSAHEESHDAALDLGHYRPFTLGASGQPLSSLGRCAADRVDLREIGVARGTDGRRRRHSAIWATRSTTRECAANRRGGRAM